MSEKKINFKRKGKEVNFSDFYREIEENEKQSKSPELVNRNKQGNLKKSILV